LIQLNVDAATFASSQSIGAAIVARDHLGSFVAVVGGSYAQVVSPELAEAYVTRFALSWTNEEGMDNLVVAPDCLSVVQRFNMADKDRSAIGCVIQDVKSLVSRFNNVSIVHCSHIAELCCSCFSLLYGAIL
jgi:hypothetical protein